MSKRSMFTEQNLEDIYQGEKFLYESMCKTLSFLPTMSWEEHCEFTGRFRERVARERAATPVAERTPKRRGKSLQAKKAP